MLDSSWLHAPPDTLDETLSSEAAMRRQGVTIFLLFFGIATLDALMDGQWPRIVFWLAMGVTFAALDWWGSRRRRSAHPSGSDHAS